MSTENIVKAIIAEREYQDKRWGHVTDDTVNTPWMWVSYIVKYASKWMVGTFLPLGLNTVDDFRASMVKTAALAVAAIESVDRQRQATGKTFYQ